MHSVQHLLENVKEHAERRCLHGLLQTRGERNTGFTWSPKPLPKAAACCTATTRAKYFTDESEHSAVSPAISSKASLLWLTNRSWSGGPRGAGPILRQRYQPLRALLMCLP